MKIAGYSIIELLVVMTVLGILATAAMPLMELTARRTKERELKLALHEIRRAIDDYKKLYDAGRIAKISSVNGYPSSLQVLANGVPDAGGGPTIYFLRPIPKDPFAAREVPAELSWGLRSYFSSAEQPQAGVDVYDVYSTVSGVGINGIPYRKW